ncbi:MAG: DNA gyrase subunit A [Candidatus Vogelbacteria bacterium]|nr:DNA gyrase subunit A [Candidatus Vogelbacteria bacterium]
MADDNKIKEIKRIIPTDIVGEMKESYIDYAMSVIISRALPDVRDGLKPVHRRILYTMHELGLTPAAKFRKCAKITGDTAGNYHPHGTIAIYDAMVRLAQNFSLLHPLVLGQGNFGSIDGDPPAAERYTEAKLSPLALELLKDIDKDTVDFIPNYENTRREPTLLPSRVPNLLVNGTLGIAVGMATKIPPHNLREVMAALIHLADNPEATTEDLMRFVKGPDFPTGAVIFNQKEIHHALATGRGGVIVRGETEIVEPSGGRTGGQVIITSIPYQVNKADLIVKLADLVREKKIEGIRDIREESTTLDDIRIVIELKTGAFPQKIVNALYKNTELETAFHYNTLALVDGVPKLLSLHGLLEEFLSHRENIVTRRSRFELNRALEREHILLGLKKAIDIIDQIIAAIRQSTDAPEAHRQLMGKFKFSELQATAILEMRLQKLAGLEIKKVLDELKEKQELIKELKTLLGDPKQVRQVVKAEFEEIKNKYGVDRKTKIIKHGVKEIAPEDLVPEKESVLVVTAGGYVKRTDPAEYRVQRRGGVGSADLDIKEEDFVTMFLSANTHSDLLFFSDKGKVYQIKMYDVPEGKRATRGKSIMNFLPLSSDEKITSVLPVPKAAKHQDLSIFMLTKLGVAKKVALGSLRDVRRNGIIAIKLSSAKGGQEDDALWSSHLVDKGDEVILASRAGQAIRFRAKDIRQMGRSAGGVRAMRLGKNDQVVGASVIKNGAKGSAYLVMTENGYGKKTKLAEYKTQKRGGSGIKTAKITSKTGKLVGGRVVDAEESEVIAVSKQGQVIRTALDQIPTLGRQTQGVRIMKLREGDRLASLTFL